MERDRFSGRCSDRESAGVGAASWSAPLSAAETSFWDEAAERRVRRADGPLRTVRYGMAKTRIQSKRPSDCCFLRIAYWVATGLIEEVQGGELSDPHKDWFVQSIKNLENVRDLDNP